MDADSTVVVFRDVGVALAIGLLIGLERGWQQREAGAGQRVAGLRTFAIIGIIGGVSGLLALTLGPAVLGMGLIAMASILIAAHFVSTRETDGFGITSEMAAMATFVLAALATTGAPALGAAGAVVVATLLGLKPELHRWIERLNRAELIAALQLLMISVLVLPLMPDRGLGPWDALNPYRLWMLVVLVAAISFAGHFAVRLLGQTRGILTTGIFGGLASSTALTLNFARLSQRTRGLDALLAVGIALSLGMGMVRMLIVATAANAELAGTAALALTSLMGVALLVAGLLRLRVDTASMRAPRRLGPPFRLKDTLRFAVLLIVITLAANAAHRAVGEAGVYVVAIIAAMGDLTAVTLSIAQLASNGVATATAAQALVLAAISSVLFKGVLAYALGGRRLGLFVSACAILMSLAGVALIWIMRSGWLPVVTTPL